MYALTLVNLRNLTAVLDYSACYRHRTLISLHAVTTARIIAGLHQSHDCKCICTLNCAVCFFLGCCISLI